METLFEARPWIVRKGWRLWRKFVLVGLLKQEKWRYIVPPREISQERMDTAIRRGQELAKEHGWSSVGCDDPHTAYTSDGDVAYRFGDLD